MPSPRPLGQQFVHFLTVFGPGLVVMLADTDAGSVVTAAQSGAQWGFQLLPLQLLLIPILYIVQELTIRLGIVTGKGHGELIREHFGKKWAWLSISTLLLACVGAIITEFSAIAGVGALFNIPAVIMIALGIATLSVVVFTGSYRSVERIAIILGLFELVFVFVAVASHPTMQAISVSIAKTPFRNGNFYYLAAANIGAVIMPWMIFYQQSAVIDKGLQPHDIRPARFDTAWGSILTQVIMAAVLIAVAATIGTHAPNTPLASVQQIADALTPFLGVQIGKLLFAMGMLGAAMIASIVVSLTAAWGLGEVMDYPHSLALKPREAPWFYAIFTLSLLLGGGIVLSGMNLVNLSIAVEVMNALLLPVVLGFLYFLAERALPKTYAIRGWYRVMVGMIILVTSAFAVYAGGFMSLAQVFMH